MVNRITHANARERIDVLCRAAAEADDFRAEVLDILRSVVGFDAHVWLLTDPLSTVGAAPHAEVPARNALPELIKYKYLTPINRWTELAARDIRSASLASVTNGDLSRSLVWRHVLRAHDVIDVASCVMIDRAACWGFLDLWRCRPSVAFTEDELSLLADVSGPLARAIRHRQASTFARIPTFSADTDGPVVVLINDDLEVQSQTQASEPWLRTLLPGNSESAPIPASVYNVAAQLLAREQGVDPHEATARLHLIDGLWLTARAARIGSAIAVSLETSTPADRLAVFALAYALSERETELLRMLADGSDTRVAAQRLFLSELTVQDHLKSVFAKTGIHNRRTLLARILGTRAT